MSGAGAKLSPTGVGEFTAVAAKELQFMLVDAGESEMRVRTISAGGDTIDQFTIVKEDS